MSRFTTLWQRELFAHFLSATSYMAMVVFLLASGSTFLWVLWKALPGDDPPTVLLMVSLTIWLPIAITVVTMGLFVEEKRSGTLEALMTTPVTDWEVVLSKYAGALTFLVVMLAPSAGFLYAIQFLNQSIWTVDLHALAAGYFILFLIAAAGTSVGLVISLLSPHQIVAGIGCFAALCLPPLLYTFSDALPKTIARGFVYISAELHIVDFARGVIDSRPIVWYVSITCLMLFVATRVLESRRWT
jgi:ABC-2 type transport system permease protein